MSFWTRQIYISFLVVLTSLSAFAVQPDFLIEGKTTVKDLVAWELVRLNEFEGEVKVTFPKNSPILDLIKKELKLSGETFSLKEIEAFLKAKIKLSPPQEKELLGVLRAANLQLRLPGETPGDTYKTAILEELSKIRGGSNAPLKLGKELEASVRNLLGIKPSDPLTPQNLIRAFKSKDLDKKKMTPEALAPLLGEVRAQAPEIRGNEFAGDFKADTWLDQNFAKIKNSIEPPKNPFAIKSPTQIDKAIKDFFPSLSRSSGGQTPPQSSMGIQPNGQVKNFPQVDLPKIISPIAPNQNSGHVRGNAGFDFGNFGGSQGGSGSGGLAVNPDVLGNSVGTVSEKALKKQKEGAFSLVMRTTFTSNPNAISSCQMTVVKKEETGDSCAYTAATARHCLVDESNPSAQIMGMQIDPFGEIPAGLIKRKFDPDGNDFALMTFRSSCQNVPVIPIREEGLQNQQEIIVDTVRGTLVGKSKDALDGNSLLALDVRSPSNKGLGIYQGDSGGGVATLNSEGQLELAGVISSKPVDPGLHGIGFFASKSSLDWARQEVNAQLVAHQTATSSDKPTH